MTKYDPTPAEGADPTKYEATFEPVEGAGAERVAVGEREGATLAADEFAREALRELPDRDGRITIANLPEDQAEETPDEEMPENQ